MSVLEALILGLVQGLTEFLPVSSSGHLVVFQKVLGIHPETINVLSFDVAVHMATLVAVIVVLWHEVLAILKKPLGKMTWLIIVGTIPTAVIGLAFKDLFQGLYESGASLGIEFIITGLVLLYAESVRSRNKGLESMTYADAAVVGTAQGLAILPAVSRSGLTLAGALARGLNREFALRFSFLMSIPAILGAAVLDGKDLLSGTEGAVQNVATLPLVVGMVAAAVSGYLAVKFMLKIFSSSSLKVFSYYVFILGGLILIDQLFFGVFFARLF